MANFWDSDPIATEDTSTSSNNFWEQDPVVEDTSIPEDKLDPKVQIDINKSTASTREPIVNATDNGKPIDLNYTTTPGESKGLFGDFMASYSKRIGNTAKDVNENFTEPFKMDKSAGNEAVQRFGDVSSRVGSSALSLLDTATAPISAAGTAAFKDVGKIFMPEDATEKQKIAMDEAADDFGDVASIPLTFRLPGEPLGKIVKGKSVAKEAATATKELELPSLSQADRVEIESGLNKAKGNIEDSKAIAKGASEQKAAESVYKDSKTLRDGLLKNKMELTPELYSKHIEEPVANAVNAGAPLDAIESSLRRGLTEAKLPETKVNDLIENSVGKFRAMQEATQERALIPKGKDPFVSKESAPKVIFPKQVEAVNPSVVDNVPTNTIDDLPEPPEQLAAPQAIKAYQSTQTVKATKGDKLVNAKEMESILNGTGTQLSTSLNNDLSAFYGISRTASKKNAGKYFGGDNVVGDYRLARITNEREQGNKILPGLIGTEDGSIKNIERMTKEGTVIDDFDVKPYQTIQKEARDAGLSTDKINEFRIAANALDDYKNIDLKVTKLNDDITKLKNAVGPSTPEVKAKIDKAIQAKSAELKELAGKKTYEAYVDKDGNRIGLPKQRAEQIFLEFSKTPEGKQYMDDMQKFSGHLVDMRVEAGLMSKAEADALKEAHPYYLSAQRDVEDYADLKQFISAKGASKGVQARKIGESDYTGDPVENTVMNVMGTVRSTQRNRERQQMVEHLLEHLDDGAFQKIFRESKDDVLAAIQDAKHNPKASAITSATDITRTPEGMLENTGNFSVFYNGKRIDLTVKDSKNNILVNTLLRPKSPEEVGLGYKALLGAAQIKRNLITTYNPIFSIGSMMRESMGYAFAADAKAIGRANQYKFWKTFTTANKLRKDPELYKMLRQNISPGALNRDYQHVGGTELVNKVANSKNFYDQSTSASKIAAVLKKPFSGIAHNLEEFAQYSDIATRARYYDDLKVSLIKQGRTAEEAETMALAGARRLGTNYQEQGASQVFNKYKAVTPFLKTTVNAITKDFSALRYRPQQVAEATGVLAGLVYAANQYNNTLGGVDNIDPRVRMTNIILKTGTGPNDYIKLPGPFSMYGRMSNLAAEGLDNAFIAMANKVVDTQKEAANEVVKQIPNSKLSGDDLTTLMMDAIVGQVNIGSMLPVGVATGSEIVFNKDAFGKAITPDFMKKLDSSEQVLPGKTSQLAVELGKKTGMSPITLDHIITSNLGGLGDVLLSGSNMIISAAKGKEQPEVDLGRIVPGLDRFSGYGSKVPKEGTEQQYSRIGQQLKSINATLTKKKEDAKTDPDARKEYLEYAEENRQLINLYKTVVEPADNRISAIYKQLNRLQAGNVVGNETTKDKELLGDPKLKSTIDELRNTANDVRQKAMSAIETHKERYGDLWESRLPVTGQTDLLMSPFRSNKPTGDIKPFKDPVKPKDTKVRNLEDLGKKTKMIIEPMSMPVQVMEEKAYNEAVDGFSNSPNKNEPYKPSLFEKYAPNVRSGLVDKYKDFIINRTLKLEGEDKYTENVENGKVTPTKFGVTLDTLKRENPNATAKDVRELTRDKAVAIYKDTYWDKAQVDKAPIGLQDLIFDGNINHGVPGMTKVIQRALNDLGAGLKLDGNMGNKTLNKLDEYPVAQVRAAILKRRKALYDQHPDKGKFGDGWDNRLSQLTEIPKEAIGA